MRKTDKKIDNQLRVALTDVCETALKQIDGFEWLTHLVNYANFPKSLQVICVFDTNQHLATFTANGGETGLTDLIQSKLNGIGIKLKNPSNHISYDSEENCSKEHNGNWANRFG